MVADAAARAVEFVGLPEAQLNLAQAVVYLAAAPKSNRVTVALGRAQEDARNGPRGEVPAHLRDAHYPGAPALGHGEGYRYPHDDPRGWVAQDYRPAEVAGHVYYEPSEHGAEAALAERLRRPGGADPDDPTRRETTLSRVIARRQAATSARAIAAGDRRALAGDGPRVVVGAPASCRARGAAAGGHRLARPVAGGCEQPRACHAAPGDAGAGGRGARRPRSRVDVVLEPPDPAALEAFDTAVIHAGRRRRSVTTSPRAVRRRASGPTGVDHRGGARRGWPARASRSGPTP